MLGKALKEAKCVIVLWTENSTRSDWVKDEAARGKKRKILVPAQLDDTEIPLGFGRIEAADLRNWNGDVTNPEFVNFLSAIRSCIGKKVEDPGISPTPVWWGFIKFKSAYLVLPVLLVAFVFLYLQFFKLESTRLATELWKVEGSRATEMLASKTFLKSDGLDKIEAWLTQELKAMVPEQKTPIKVNLRVPADLKSEDVQFDTEPQTELRTFINVTAGTSKARTRMPLTRKYLGEIEEEFTMEFTKTGYVSVPVKINPGKEKNKSFLLKQKKIAVAVKHFKNDEKNIATRLSRKLTKHKQFKITNPDALEALYSDIERANVAFAEHVAIQTAMRNSLGVDFIINGAVEME